LKGSWKTLSLLSLVDQARSTFCVVRETSVKFGLHAGNMKFNTQIEE
jgi:hypothetical protein